MFTVQRQSAGLPHGMAVSCNGAAVCMYHMCVHDATIQPYRRWPVLVHQLLTAIDSQIGYWYQCHSEVIRSGWKVTGGEVCGDQD